MRNPIVINSAIAGEAAGAAPADIAGVTPDDDTPAFGCVPGPGDSVPAPDLGNLQLIVALTLLGMTSPPADGCPCTHAVCSEMAHLCDPSPCQ